MKATLDKIFWPDARGWIGIGVFGLTILLLMMMRDPDMRGDEFFQTIATVIISNGLMAVVAWAYSATKGGGEQADANANVARKLADRANLPAKVEVVNPPASPVPVATKDEEELPPYARP